MGDCYSLPIRATVNLMACVYTPEEIESLLKSNVPDTTVSNTTSTKYRGYVLQQVGNSWTIFRGNSKVRSCNTAWSCCVYIDELLSP
jgi:hypothetical protein